MDDTPEQMVYGYNWFHENINLQVSSHEVQPSDTLTVTCMCSWVRKDGKVTWFSSAGILLYWGNAKVVSVDPPDAKVSIDGQTVTWSQFVFTSQNHEGFDSPTTFKVTFKLGAIPSGVTPYVMGWGPFGEYDYAIIGLNKVLPDIPMPPTPPSIPKVLTDTKSLMNSFKSDPDATAAMIQDAAMKYFNQNAKYLETLMDWSLNVDKLIALKGLPSNEALRGMYQVESNYWADMLCPGFVATNPDWPNIDYVIKTWVIPGINDMNNRLRNNPSALADNVNQADEV